MITIKLHDGTRIENLSLNVNEYISDTQIDKKIFINNTQSVTIIDNDNETTYTNMVLDHIVDHNDGTYGIIMRPKTSRELIEETITDIQMAITEVYEFLSSAKEE